MSMTEADFHRYLTVKQTVDDRALSTTVLDRLFDVFSAGDRESITCLDLGAGLGDMPIRFLERGSFPRDIPITYVAIDERQSLIPALIDRVTTWAAARADTRIVNAEETDLTVTTPEWTMQLHGRCVDARTALETWGPVDLVVAKSFLDLVSPATFIPSVLEAIDPAGVGYFPLTFDGGTAFRPRIGPIDRTIVEAYHETMDRRSGAPGTSRAAGATIDAVVAGGGTLVAAGGSDWVVHPVDGRYPADEDRFLAYILDTVAESIIDHPTIDPPVDVERWHRLRGEHLARGELVYIAHQLDLLVRPD